MTPLVDAHAHFSSVEALNADEVVTLLCATDPAEAPRILSFASDHVIPCCALHPWKVDNYSVDQMLPFMGNCGIVGEIGLDNVWTDSDMTKQIKALWAQLEYAQNHNKPVVLHTKGKEREIAAMLRPYSMPKLVHWYSCDTPPVDYIEQDCYFTVGPDHAINPAVSQVIRMVPLDRLLTETDGLEAVEWALDRKIRPEEIPSILRSELRSIAAIKGITEETARAAVYENLMRFLRR
ncbi:MAG: TatD family hydrolase [Clostridia bacterium]|nr:TatD family hydrolase [Clostridia bacterium]